MLKFIKTNPSMKLKGVRKTGLMQGWFEFIRKDGRNRFDGDVVFFPGPRAVY